MARRSPVERQRIDWRRKRNQGTVLCEYHNMRDRDVVDGLASEKVKFILIMQSAIKHAEQFETKNPLSRSVVSLIPRHFWHLSNDAEWNTSLAIHHRRSYSSPTFLQKLIVRSSLRSLRKISRLKLTMTLYGIFGNCQMGMSIRNIPVQFRLHSHWFTQPPGYGLSLDIWWRKTYIDCWIEGTYVSP